MSEWKCKRVFILGAGCSANYGYPLNVKLVEQLREFKIPDECPIIQGAVSKSIEVVLKSPEAMTLDDLVRRCEERYKKNRTRIRKSLPTKKSSAPRLQLLPFFWTGKL
jgi:hypothetical protein